MHLQNNNPDKVQKIFSHGCGEEAVRKRVKQVDFLYVEKYNKHQKALLTFGKHKNLWRFLHLNKRSIICFLK